MRVLFYISERGWTGSARAFVVAATGLRERGHQVIVVCPPGSEVEQRLDPTSYEVVALRTSGRWVGAARRLRHVLLERFAEVVFVHGERDQLVAASAARMAGRSAVLRRVPFGEEVRAGRRARLAMKLVATGYVFATEHDARRFGTPLASPLESVVAPLGVDANVADSLRGPARALAGAAGVAQLIFCAYDRTSRIRAAPVLRVVALLAERHPELRLAVAGPGSLDEELGMHAAALRITRVVRFLGDRPDAFSVLRAADIGWVVAYGDDGAFALLDLMAARVPVLAVRSALAEHFVADGITGILFDSTDAAMIAAPVARLLAHEDERAAMASAARARVVRDFALGTMIDGFEQAAMAASEKARW
ncbi:MAG: glycosyltransferase family 4 protein [Gemmatimonadaceae bacterium]